MIEINLLPEELKAKLKTRALANVKKAEPNVVATGRKKILLLLPLIAAVTIVEPVYLTGVSVIKNIQFQGMERKWKGLEGQRKIVDEFAGENWLLSQDAIAIKGYLDKRIGWAEKLNKLSLYLPKGIWFNSITLSSKELIIQASAFSLQKEEMNLINAFIENLKKDAVFSNDFKSMELGAVQKRLAGSSEVTDFVLVFALKK
jgi:Tfp pilus assembly protein PilN